MSQPNYIPDFELSLDGASAPLPLRASISNLSYQTGLEGCDRVEFTLANEHLRWLDHPLLKIDNSLELKIGYLPGAMPRVFVGDIVGRNATFPGSGIPTLSVVAQDNMRRLQKGNKVRWWAIPIPTVGNFPLPDLAVSAIVAAENLLVPIYEPVGAALSVLLSGAQAVAAVTDPDGAQKVIRKQADESDYAFLGRLAAENGWEMTIDHGGALGGHQLRFYSALDHLSSDVTLRYGSSLIDFTPSISDVGQIVSVSAYIWIAPIKTSFTVTVGWDWDRASLTLDIRPALIPLGQGPSSYLIEEPVTPLSAPQKILSELIPKLNRRLTAHASTIGNPNILAGTVVRIEGVGEEFGGLYRVTSATHSISSAGYRTNFECRKDIWFGSIPLPDQGAVPVKVSSGG